MTSNHIVKHAFSNINDGNMSFKWGTARDVIDNRLRFLKKHHLKPEHTVSSAIEGNLLPKLVTTTHAGAGVVNPHQAIPGHSLYTTKVNLPLMLLTADCIPIIISAIDTPLLAVAHLSAKTLDQGLLKNTLQAIAEHTKIEPKKLSVIFGPHIKVESYHHTTPPHLSSSCWQTAVAPHGIHRVSVNLTKAAVIQLTELGVENHRITVHPTDTATDTAQFSHYRSRSTQEPEGRFATVAWLEESKPNHAHQN